MGGTATEVTSLIGSSSLVLGRLLNSWRPIVATNIGWPHQDAMHLPHTPAPAVAGEKATAVEIARKKAPSFPH